MNKKTRKEREQIKALIDRAENLNIDYIQCFDNVFSKNECDSFIKKINKFKDKGIMRKGKVGYNSYVESLKVSMDIDVYKDCGKKYKDDDIDNMYLSLHNKIGVCIYSYLLSVGVLGKQFLGLNVYNVKNFVKEEDIPDMPKEYVVESIKLRKYEKNKGGYYMLHNDATNHHDRTLAVIVYLNDTEYGGETSFPLLKRSIKPKAGRVLVFPSYFTHMHYGRTSPSDKYVVISHIINDKITYKYKQEKEKQWEEQ
jgi:hypothetical protein